MRSTLARGADIIEERPELGDSRTAAYVAPIPQIAEAVRSRGISGD